MAHEPNNTRKELMNLLADKVASIKKARKCESVRIRLEKGQDKCRIIISPHRSGEGSESP